MSFETPNNLTPNFFNSVKTYKMLLAPTKHELFNKHVKSFYKSNLDLEKQKFEKEIKIAQNKIALLEDYEKNYRDLTLKADEKNWGYVEYDKIRIYIGRLEFLREYSTPKARKIKISSLKKEIKIAEEKIKAIEICKEDKQCQEHIANLKEADRFFEYLKKSFVKFLSTHPDHKFLKENNVNYKTFNKAFFDSHLDEILTLKNDKPLEKWYNKAA